MDDESHQTINKYMEQTKKIKNILIGGEKQAGKTYMVQQLVKILRDNGKEIKGYYTYMYREEVDKNKNGFDIYMYPASLDINDRKKTEENYVGCCNGRERTINKEVFEKLGVNLLSGIYESDIVIMDEVGFFEADVKRFTDKVCEIIEGKNPVIATIKEKYDDEYINKVRNYKEREDTIFVHVTLENRKEIFEQLEKIVLEQFFDYERP